MANYGQSKLTPPLSTLTAQVLPIFPFLPFPFSPNSTTVQQHHSISNTYLAPESGPELFSAGHFFKSSPSPVPLLFVDNAEGRQSCWIIRS